LCFDADAAGEKAAERSLPHLLSADLLVRCAEMPPGEDPDSLIRSRGGPAFAEVIAQSKDFFEFQLERAARKPEFATPRGKIAVAHKFAEFISLIPDGVTREAVLNNAATRLEISADQLRASLKKPQEFARPDDDAALDAKPLEPTKLDPTQQWLAFLALRDPGIRKFLLSKSWKRTFDDGTPSSALLSKIFAAEFRAGDVPSVNAWLSTLEKGDEAALSTVLELEMPRDPQIMAEDCWHELERRDILRRRQAAESRLRAPGLTFEEQARLHQQVLELHRLLAALPPPRPPKSDT
jgi:DNA primase